MSTRITTLVHAVVLPLVFGAGCSGCQGTDPDAKEGVLPSDYEGDDPGECTDKVDNDRNGYFDCNDIQCYNHPDCVGYNGPGTGGAGTGGAGTGGGTGTGGTGTGGTGTGGTGTGGTGTGTTSACVDPPCDLTSFDLTMHVDIDFDGLLAALGICDCYMDFAASGTFQTYDASLDRVEFYGDWQRVDPGVYGTTGTGTGTTTGTGTVTGIFNACDPYAPPDPCDNFISDGFWWTTNPTYHSFFFDDGTNPAFITDWITYEFPGGYVPNMTSPSNAHQFYITQLFAPYDHTPATPTSNKQVVEDDPGGQFTVYIDWEVVFQK